MGPPVGCQNVKGLKENCKDSEFNANRILPFQLLNNGPSTFSKASLEVSWPYRFGNGSLLYITSFDTDGPINCTTDVEINPLNISVRHIMKIKVQKSTPYST